MANIPIWPGTSSFAQVSASYYNTPSTGSSPTPFGFYDNDPDFKTDANKVANFCARRLGYPIENVELQDLNFWTAFEEATTVYGNELYAYQVRENMLNLEGLPITTPTLNNTQITPNMGNIIRISEQYGTEAGSGGNVNWYSGSVILTGSVQEYDLNQWAVQNGISASNLEVKRVYYQGVPASATYYYGGGIGLGIGGGGFMGALGGAPGFAGYGYNYLVTPLSYNVGAIQEVELGQDILLSAYSFEIHNNKLRIFPVPLEADTGTHYWFQYVLKNERLSDSLASGSGNTGAGLITNVSNVPFANPVYAQINSIGRSWIFEYTLSLSKEMLGYVRNKYSQIPIPGAEVTLNGDSLLASATDTKNALIERLRAYFDETSRKSMLERRKDEADFSKQELNNVPMTIYIG
jgi:hypothetical protein